MKERIIAERTFDFTDLVLIIGTNPLPNYVVAKYFIAFNRNLKRIWLIYSENNDYYEGTGQYAEDIKNVLEKELGRLRYSHVKFRFNALSNISQADTIKKESRKQLEGEKGSIKKVHLNYTGGTKAMAVHVYQALMEQWQACFSASYLDARDYRIRMDNDPEYDSDDLRNFIRLEWEDLFRIHNTKKMASGKEYIDKIDEKALERIMQQIMALASADKIHEIKEWEKKAKTLFENKSDEKHPQTIQETLSGFNSATHAELFSFLRSFPLYDQYVGDNGKWIYRNFKISGQSKNTPELVKFLSGTWLEAYVYWVMKQRIKQEKIHKSQLMSNLILRTLIGNGTYKAEIDVLITNGYQICGISCGTSPETKELKAKGFEIILRSRQLGGDEARAVLVTLLDTDKTIELYNDLKASTGSGGDKFLVLGINDLTEEIMWRKLKKHIYK